MASPEPSTTLPQGTGADFRTTRWADFLGLPPVEARAAVAGRYYYPIYAFLRRSGNSPDKARELAHSFFERFLSRDSLAEVDPKKGKFRTFLLTCLRHHLHNLNDYAKAGIRNPGMAILSIDEQDAEGNYLREPADPGDPVALLDRIYARQLLNEILEQLRAEHKASGHVVSFPELAPFLLGQGPHAGLANLARGRNLSEDALRQTVNRLRVCFRKLLRTTVGNTLGDPREVDDEIRYLASLWAGATVLRPVSPPASS